MRRCKRLESSLGLGPQTILPLLNRWAQSAADAGHLHLGQVRRGGGAQLGVAVVPASPERAKGLGDLRVRFAAAEEGAQVVAAAGEQAGGEPTLRGGAGAGGM